MQQPSPIRLASQHVIVPTAAMACRAGPAISLSTVDDTRSNRIQFHIADCGPEIFVVEGGRKIPPLPEMTTPGSQSIDALRMAHVQRPHYAFERVCRFRHHDQVNVIRHQAIGEHLESVQCGVFTQPAEIRLSVDVARENCAAPIPALSNVEWNARPDESGNPRHSGSLPAATPRHTLRNLRVAGETQKRVASPFRPTFPGASPGRPTGWPSPRPASRSACPPRGRHGSRCG